MIWSIITDLLAPFWPYIAGALAIVGGWLVAKRQGAKGERAKHKAEAAEANEKAHERMNNADLGIDASDAERIERLRDFAARHGDRQAKGKSR